MNLFSVIFTEISGAQVDECLKKCNDIKYAYRSSYFTLPSYVINEHGVLLDSSYYFQFYGNGVNLDEDKKKEKFIFVEPGSSDGNVRECIDVGGFDTLFKNVIGESKEELDEVKHSFIINEYEMGYIPAETHFIISLKGDGPDHNGEYDSWEELEGYLDHKFIFHTFEKN